MTRQQKRNRLVSWIRERFASTAQTETKRRILVEPLEARQLLAGDVFEGLLGTAGDLPFSDQPSHEMSSSAEGESGLVGEGEDANDLVALAQAIADSGTRFFGAAWCQFCTDQRRLFEDGASHLPFIEVTNPDRSPNQIAIDEGITEYPTWEFSDGTRLTGVQSIETLAARSGITTIPQSSIPFVEPIADRSVAIGSPLHVPIDAYDPNGNPLTVSVTSDNPSLLTAEVLGGNRSLVLTTGFGDMTFELFESRAPRPTGRVIQLANDGFYDGVTFHRIIDNFVIQGGDPTGTGSGGSTLGDFDDQFHLDLQHNATGMLSYAKSTDDTNDSQFFITEGQQRFLDFNHSVFGILTEGESVREAISNTAVGAGDRPTNDVVIQDASIITDTENSVVILRPTGAGTGSATITVTVTDSEGNSTSDTFDVSVVNDTANGAPFLNDVPAVETSEGTPVVVTLTSQDKEGDAPIYSVQPLGNTAFDVTVNAAGEATVTPPAGFTGQLQFLATVRQQSTPTTNSATDNQVVTVNVTQSVPTSVDLDAGSDSGASDSDDVTNAGALTFTVGGTIPGATVNVLAGTQIVGSATATSSTTTVNVTNAAILDEGQVVFSATQTTGGQTSGNSPGLTVTLDRTGPAVTDTSGIAASVIVNTQLSVDLQNNEEGAGLVYEIATGPAGAAIDPSTGLLTWTPAVGQLGAQTIQLRTTDAAGNQTTQDISINVIEEPLVRFSLNAVDDLGNPLTSVSTGQEFLLQVVVQDLRPGASATGVFAGYLDLLYDDAIVEPIANSPITYNAPYTSGQSGDVSTPGLIDELGAFSSDTSRQGSDARVVATVAFTAKAAGNPNFRSEAPDNLPNNNILLYDDAGSVAFSRVDFQRSDFAVGANFEVVDDSFNFDEDTGPHTLNVLDNDTTTNGAVLSIQSVSSASGGGSVSVASDGLTLVYTPGANFNGAESFTYVAQNQAGVQETGTVTVQVTDVNDPPEALNDSFSVVRNSIENVLDVLGNDSSGVDTSAAETLSVTAVSAGSAGGTIVIGSSGSTLRYTPANGFQGTETFTYTLSDGRGGTAQGSVSVNVDLENPPPTPQNDQFTIDEDAAEASFDVLANDTTDDPTETLSVSAVGTPQLGGTASVAADGQSILYRPGPNFDGVEIFTYTVRDSGGAESQALVTFTVTGSNDAPDAVDDSLNALSSDASTSLDVLSNDDVVDTGETLTITSVSQPPAGSGTLAIASDGRSLTYTPPSSTFEGTFAFTYTVSDGNGQEDTATVNLTVENFVPRKISGVLEYATGGILPGLAGVSINLRGTDATGASVSRDVTLNPDGSYEFDDLPPGDYTLSRAAIPFLHDEGQSIPISSGATDGDAVSNLAVSGGLRPQFFDIRDFLSTNSENNVAVAFNADGSQNWVSPQGDWSEYSDLQFTLDPANDTVQVQAVDPSSQAVSGSIQVAPASQVHEVGRESTMRLIRLRLPATGAGLTAASQSTATTPSGEGESASLAGGLVGEGEGVPAPLIEAVEMPAVLRRSEQPSDDANEQVTVSGRRQLLSSSAPGDAESTDAAMQDVLPAMEVALSDDLEGVLTDSEDAATVAGDELFGSL